MAAMVIDAEITDRGRDASFQWNQNVTKCSAVNPAKCAGLGESSPKLSFASGGSKVARHCVDSAVLLTVRGSQ